MGNAMYCISIDGKREWLASKIRKNGWLNLLNGTTAKKEYAQKFSSKEADEQINILDNEAREWGASMLFKKVRA